MSFRHLHWGVLALAVPIAQACDLCCLHDAPDFSATANGFSIGFSEQWAHFTTMREEGTRVANDTDQRLDSSVTRVDIAYRVSPHVALRAMLPYVYRSFRRPEGFAIDNGTESGLGDASLACDVTIANSISDHHAAFVDLLLGIKLPTGSSDRLAEEEHEVEIPGAPESGVHGHDLALGSGSWDGIVGVTAGARWQRCFATISLQYMLRSQGDHHYRYADDLIWSTGPGILLINQDQRQLGLQLLASGEYKGKDRFAGENAADTAITTVSTGAEMTLSYRQNRGLLGLDIPLLQDNSALQLLPDWRLRASLTHSF